ARSASDRTRPPSCSRSSRSKRRSLARQRRRVETKMLADERADEVVAVVVARALAKLETLARFLAGGFQLVGTQLIQEGIFEALVDQQLVAARGRADHLARIVFEPG